VTAPFAGTVIAVAREADQPVGQGEALVVLEAMKMEHEILAEVAGVVRSVAVAVGETVTEGQLLAVMDAGATAPGAQRADGEADLDEHRDDLDAVIERHALGLDDARPDAVSKRHESGRRTARENLADLVDEGTFVEYGPLIFAAQEARRSKD
jgi:pyruvate/2-oxoglutarate dehydrogenase complex dihydrolipoamide acyltransferase (E2) component